MAQLTRVSEPEIAAFVGAFALGPLRAARGIEAGTVNTSFALEIGDARFFLRIYEEQDALGAEREAALLVHLGRHGVPTPSPIAGRDGRFVRSLASKPAALFPWIEGDMRCQRGVTPDAARRVGAALAQVHRAGAPPDHAPDPGRFGPEALAARCDRVVASRDVEAQRLAEDLRARVLASGATRTSRALPSGLIHGDLFRDNVLWPAAGARSVVETPPPAGGEPPALVLLDFESAHHGPFVYDIAVTLLSWAYGASFDPAIARAIVDGYRSVRELEPVEREAFYDEAILATLRFTITRITDEAIRVGKRWQRFVARREALESLGPRGLGEVLGW